MADNVGAAFSVGDPTKVLCEGFDSSFQDGLRADLADRDPTYVQAVIDGLNSDGGRVLLLRAG